MKEDQHHKGPSYLSLKVPGTQHHHVLVVHVWGANLWEILSSLALGISPPPSLFFQKPVQILAEANFTWIVSGVHRCEFEFHVVFELRSPRNVLIHLNIALQAMNENYP